jgi:hypothetical protein
MNSAKTTYVLDTTTPLTMVLAETTGQDSIYYLHGLDLVAQSDGTTTDYLAYDGLGSVRQVLDDAGVPLLTQTFDPYGNLLARVAGSVPSLDLNPLGTTNASPVYAPAEAEVMIVDLLEYGGDAATLNKGLGNFVALRIETSKLTPAARTNLEVNLNNYREPGYVYIGYAHLSRVDVSPKQGVNPGQQIGLTGNTGLVSGSQVHLDISTFYVPSENDEGILPVPEQVRLSSSEDNPGENFQNFNRLYLIPSFEAEIIHPKLLWPDICIGVCES